MAENKITYDKLVNIEQQNQAKKPVRLDGFLPRFNRISKRRINAVLRGNWRSCAIERVESSREPGTSDGSAV